jgi:hypothetical protein
VSGVGICELSIERGRRQGRTDGDVPGHVQVDATRDHLRVMLHEVPIVSVRIESEAGNPTDEIKSVLKRLSDPRTLGGKLLALLLNSEKGSVWIEYLHGRECSIEILFSASRTRTPTLVFSVL